MTTHHIPGHTRPAMASNDFVTTFLQSEPTVRLLWNQLAHDPFTGLQVLNDQGAVLFANTPAAKTMMGEDATVAEFYASTPSDWGHEEYLAERLQLMQDVLRDAKVRHFRSICGGKQVIATVHRIQCTLPTSGPMTGLLIVTRYLGGDLRTTLQSTPDIEYREAKSVDFGPLGVLSRRELQVLALIGNGSSMPEAAIALGLSVHTVQDHRKAIGKKLGVDDRVRLAQIAHTAGLRVDDALRTRFERATLQRTTIKSATLPAYQ